MPRPGTERPRRREQIAVDRGERRLGLADVERRGDERHRHHHRQPREGDLDAERRRARRRAARAGRTRNSRPRPATAGGSTSGSSNAVTEPPFRGTRACASSRRPACPPRSITASDTRWSRARSAARAGPRRRAQARRDVALAQNTPTSGSSRNAGRQRRRDGCRYARRRQARSRDPAAPSGPRGLITRSIHCCAASCLLDADTIPIGYTAVAWAVAGQLELLHLVARGLARR